MELNKFLILERKSSSCDHGITISSTGMCWCAREVRATIASSSKNSVLWSEAVNGTILQAQGNNTTAFAFLHQQVKSKIFNKVIAVVAQRLAVKSVQKRVACTISDTAASRLVSHFSIRNLRKNMKQKISTYEPVLPCHSCMTDHQRLVDRSFHLGFGWKACLKLPPRLLRSSSTVLSMRRVYHSFQVRWRLEGLLLSCNEWHLDLQANQIPWRYHTYATSSHLFPCYQELHWFHLEQQQCVIW